jgi:hypothetical protein
LTLKFWSATGSLSPMFLYFYLEKF